MPSAWNVDLITTLALAACFLGLGQLLQSRIRFLSRTSIPTPAIGGMLFALAVFSLREWLPVKIDTTLRSPLQTAFFTTIGLKATVGLLSMGGRRLLMFWLIATGTALVQNAFGVAVAALLGAPLLLGIVCGSIALTGGPATALAFGESFEKLGLTGANALAIAAATFGIMVASLVGNPVATYLIRRRGLDSNNPHGKSETKPAPEASASAGALVHNLLLLLIVMGVGVWLSNGMGRLGYTVPAFIGPMILAAAIRYFDDRTGLLRLDHGAVETISTASLAFFLVIAMMDLRLWELAALAVPMLIILLGQIVITILYCVATTYLIFGRDYEAAVSTSGHIGFGLGITANAVANMKALEERSGPAPKSFLVVPIVGAFFIDLSNSLVIAAAAQLLARR